MLVYCVDDVYIQLTIAKNLFLHNSYGINPGEFSTPSSSIIYPLILYSCFLVSGVNIYFPLIFNIVFANILLVFIYNIISDYFLQEKLKVAVTFFLISYINIYIYIFTGMEHLFYALIFILFLNYSLQYLFFSVDKSKPKLYFIAILAFLLTAIRYEGIIILFLISALFFGKTKNKEGFLILFFGLLPVFIWGIFSAFNGAYFFPYSVILRALYTNNQPNSLFFAILNRFYWNLNGYYEAAIFIISIINLILIFIYKRYLFQSKILFYSNLIVCIITISQFIFVSSYFRYILHILIMNMLLLFINVYHILTKNEKFIKNNTIINLIIFILIILSVLITFRNINITSQAINNIYEQQIQTSNFINEFSKNEVVALNDIGAVSYYSNSKIIDLCGLSDKNVFKMKINKIYDKNFLMTYCDSNNTKLIIIYESWFDKMIPDKWQLIGKMFIKNNYICGDDNISFYIVDTNLFFQKRSQFLEFCKTLPKSIEYK